MNNFVVHITHEICVPSAVIHSNMIALVYNILICDGKHFVGEFIWNWDYKPKTVIYRSFATNQKNDDSGISSCKYRKQNVIGFVVSSIISK